MRTEQPAERVERRLSSQREDPREPDADPDADDDDTSLSRWLPEATPTSTPGWLTAIRADPGRAGVVGLGIVGAIAVLVTVFTVLRDDAPQVMSAKLPPVQMVSSERPPPGSSAPQPDAPVVVSVVGLVQHPGLVTLDAGARIADALAAAGGAREGADLVGLNLARKLADGEQIVVGIASPLGAPSTMGSSIASEPGGVTAALPGETSSAQMGSVNLNTATVEQLDVLPGIGPITAAAIVAWRDANGQFANVDQLGEVDGIGPVRLEKLRGLVDV